MATSGYTPMRGREQIESFVKNTPNFSRIIRFENHPERDGYSIITDGSSSFGLMQNEDIEKLLNDEIQVDELKSQPEILKHISCYDIDKNTKLYKKEESKTTIDRFEEKISFFAPNKKMLVWLAIIVVIAIATPFLSKRVFSEKTVGYSDEFYTTGLIENRLLNLQTSWRKVAETEETYDAKSADYISSEILKLAEDVDRTRLSVEQKKALDDLLAKVQAQKEQK